MYLYACVLVHMRRHMHAPKCEDRGCVTQSSRGTSEWIRTKAWTLPLVQRYNRSSRTCKAAGLQQRLFYCSKLYLLIKFRASHIYLLVSSQSSHLFSVSIKIPIVQEIYAPLCFCQHRWVFFFFWHISMSLKPCMTATLSCNHCNPMPLTWILCSPVGSTWWLKGV